jgi:hypothetical protein
MGYDAFMTTTCRWFTGLIGPTLLLLAAGIVRAEDGRCTDGRWIVDEGPITVARITIGAIALDGGVPSLDAACEAVRWKLEAIGDGTKLRALFLCTVPQRDLTGTKRVPLRLTARIGDDCTHMAGVVGTRPFWRKTRFTATLAGGGCHDNGECRPDAYCARRVGGCTDTGECTPRPQGCPDVVLPVCGCDRRTYFNACEAAAAGVSIAHDGACESRCGGIAGVPCDEGEFCDLPAGMCGASDLQGECVPVSDACPEFYQPVCGCDGETYANDCFRQAARVQQDHDGACESGGCTSAAECLPNEFCQSPEGQCGAPGSCAFIEQGCDGVYDPVCGCDDITYDNRCAAAMHAVSIAQVGPCQCVPKTAPCETTCDCYRTLGQAFCDDCPLLCPNCGDYWQCEDGACVEECGMIPPGVQECGQEGCADNADCADGAYCARTAGQCEARGACEPRPALCPELYAPVCGCDGTTYGNRCEAAAAGVSVAREGECEDVVCGGIAGLPCPMGFACDLPAGECQAADLQGRCVPIGDACPADYVPVCGCDGVTYSNDCTRLVAGVQKARDGACDCLPLCCPFGGRPIDVDADLCADVCAYDVVPCACGDDGCTCAFPDRCETACDCDARFGDSFCTECLALCPTCGNFWACEEGHCVERCGPVPLDQTPCPATAG